MMQHLNELEIKMKFSYRITKYHKYSNEDKKILCTSPEEWTSFSDVGKGIVSLNEYTKIESEYIPKNLLKNFPKSIQNKTIYEINEEAFEEYENYRNIYHEETKNESNEQSIKNTEIEETK